MDKRTRERMVQWLVWMGCSPESYEGASGEEELRAGIGEALEYLDAAALQSVLWVVASLAIPAGEVR